MRVATKVLQLVLVCSSLLFLFIINRAWNSHQQSTTVELHRGNEIKKLLELIQLQNQTILLLSKRISEQQIEPEGQKLQVVGKQTRAEVNLSEQKGNLDFDTGKIHEHAPISPVDDAPKGYHERWSTPVTNLERDCSSRYGVGLVDNWSKSKQVWCEDGTSSLTCYPYHQTHKKIDGRGPDLFCEAKNFVIDFSKIHGEYEKDSKPALGSQYLQFDSGSLLSTCRKTDFFKDRLFMPHQSLQFRSFKSEAEIPQDTIHEPLTTYLLARDEDCENAFHSTADFMNMHLIQKVLGLDFGEVQVMLFDRHPDGPFHDLIKSVFSPEHQIIRHNHYSKKKVRFERLIFHLESPAGLIFPKVSRPDPLRCYETELFQSYRRFILKSMGLLDTPPPPIPEVTLILRHRTAKKNVGRILENEEAVINVLKSGNMMKLNVVDLAQMRYSDQIKMIRSSNVIVGVHGAGLMNIMFAAEEAVLVEIHPSYRQDRHFRHASRMTGKIYLPLRSLSRESCVGSSDNVKVPIEEFTKTMDAALRIARQFDDGISECGIICPKEILALDSRHDAFYTTEFRKGSPVNTNFPCG